MQEDAARQEMEAAFQEFLDPLFRYFLYRISDRERAKELVQETFMRAWDYRRKGGEIRAMKPFLYTTAANLFKNELRGRKNIVSLEMLMEEGRDFASEETSADERADARLLLSRLDALDAADREILTLRYVDQLTTREAAQTLGKSENATAVALHRALKRLRALYEPTQ